VTLEAADATALTASLKTEKLIFHKTFLLTPIYYLFLQWGAAFKLAGSPEEQHKTLAWLEWREKQYDLRQRVNVYPPSSFPLSDPPSSEPVVHGALCYIATSCSTANPNYLGPAPLDVIASQVAFSVGPSGPNSEYLFKLADALREIPGAADEELFVLEARVRSLVAAAATGGELSSKENIKNVEDILRCDEENEKDAAGAAIESAEVDMKECNFLNI
jgi:cation transport regulator ChaC